MSYLKNLKQEDDNYWEIKSDVIWASSGFSKGNRMKNKVGLRTIWLCNKYKMENKVGENNMTNTYDGSLSGYWTERKLEKTERIAEILRRFRWMETPGTKGLFRQFRRLVLPSEISTPNVFNILHQGSIQHFTPNALNIFHQGSIQHFDRSMGFTREDRSKRQKMSCIQCL